MQKIISFFWFDKEAEQAAKHYVSIFKNSKITATEPYPQGGHGAPGDGTGDVAELRAGARGD